MAEAATTSEFVTLRSPYATQFFTTRVERMSQMTTGRSSQDWQDSWDELRPHLSWMQRHSKEIIAAEHPEQAVEFINRHNGHSHRFTDEEIQGLVDGSIREAVKDWWETTVRLSKERRQRERQERLARSMVWDGPDF